VERGLGPGTPGSADGKRKGKTAAEIEAEAAKNPGGFVHYAGDVHCKSARRPGSDAFDLTFHLFDQNGSNYRFRDCDATGKFAPGKTQGFLRSKLAVARYLEREGASGADAAERDAAVPDAGEKERPERAKDQRDAVAPTDPSADEADRGNAPASGVADAASPASPPSPPTRLEAIEALLKRFDAVLSQCMYCLYGVETAEPLRRCREEGGARSASNLMTPEACAEVWRHVQPYVASLGADGRASASFARVLEKVRRAFPPESAAPRDGDPVERYLSATIDAGREPGRAFARRGAATGGRGDDARAAQRARRGAGGGGDGAGGGGG
jgi:hypothetical protein